MAKTQLDRIEEKLDALLERTPLVPPLDDETLTGLKRNFGAAVATAGPGETLPYKQKPVTAETRPDPFGGAPPIIDVQNDPEPQHFIDLGRYEGPGREAREITMKDAVDPQSS